MGRNRGGREQRGGNQITQQGSSQLTYLLPQDSAQVVASRISECRNLSLILARYIPQQVVENSDVANTRNVKWRDQWLKEQCRRFVVTDSELKKHIESTHRRWKLTISDAERFEARSLGRLVVGLGGESVLETSLTLQFITGLPIIPGSALKGLCRHYALFTLAEKLKIKPLNAAELRGYKEKKKPTPLQELDEALAAVEWSSDLITELKKADQVEVAGQFRAIFGSTDYGGACIFYDAVVSALPQSGALFEVDVMTPHFVKYYNSANAGKQIEPPSDNDSPNPLNFLTVAAGTEFAFAVGVRRGFDKSLAEQAAKWLKTALYEMGIGAKTAAGYGVFEKVK
ncbi:MAG: type III-B CRISPR module RAMP protein Cmr6 [Anaerolineae bacterium]|nr:type III-B CRISPR module RAMP protein Cmr6 [Anaerolineae bacterium]